MTSRCTWTRTIGARVTCQVASLAIALTALSAQQFGELRGTGTSPSVLSSDELITRSGGESAASMIVSDALRQFLSDGRSRTVSVIASQVKEDWVPQIDRVRVVRLSDQEVQAFREQCGALVLIRDFVVKEETASVWVGRFSRCSGSATELRYARTAATWRRAVTTGQGMGEAADPCTCNPVIDAPAGR